MPIGIEEPHKVVEELLAVEGEAPFQWKGCGSGLGSAPLLVSSMCHPLSLVLPNTASAFRL